MMSEKRSKSSAGCVLVAVVLLILLLVPVVLFWLLVRSLEGERVTVSAGTVLELDLSAISSEGPAPLDVGTLLGRPSMSLWQLTRAIDRAAEDRRVAGLLLMLRTPSLGWAGAEEVLEHVDAFRESGKPVYALLETDIIDDLTYFLATGAERIWIAPATAVAVNGLALEAQFYRGTLDKLHIEPQVIMYKEYKSAGEPFANYEMSPAMRESLEAVLDTTHERLVERIVERRGVEPGNVRDFLARGMVPAEALVAAGLADAIGFSDEVETAFTEQAPIEDYEGLSLRDYVSARDLRRARGKARIALIFGEGIVLPDAPPSPLPILQPQILAGARVAGHIREAIDDEDIEAIVFRVSSPGGSAVGSDMVRRALDEARAAGKTVVVSMGDVAGSGGYWVSMAADAIVAHPTTLTGSIGVVFTKLNLDGFFDWIGTNVERVTTTPAADLLGLGPLEESEREAILAWMEEAYGLFTGHVATYRDLAPDEVEEIARGRIWSGRDALERGLVDRLGGLDAAFDIAKQRAGLDPDEEVAVRVLPRQKSLLQVFLGGAASRTPPAASRHALEAWLERVTSRRVQVRAPEISIY